MTSTENTTPALVNLAEARTVTRPQMIAIAAALGLDAKTLEYLRIEYDGIHAGIRVSPSSRETEGRRWVVVPDL